MADGAWTAVAHGSNVFVGFNKGLHALSNFYTSMPLYPRLGFLPSFTTTLLDNEPSLSPKLKTFLTLRNLYRGVPS